MKTFHVSRHIAAPIDRVWKVLTDANQLASGPLGVTRIEGHIQLGQRLKLWTEATGARAFTLKVEVLDAPREMVWQGGMPLGLFRGVRRFTLVPKNGGTQFEMTETFSGLMSGLISRSIPDLTPSFERFANGLSQLSQKEER